MNHRNEIDSDPDPARPEREDSSGNFYSGSETFFGVFTQAQVYLMGVRLVHDGKVTQQVSDLASQIENNRRRFLHSGDVNFALQELARITSAYNQRVQAWEAEASRRERNKKTMSGGALAKMKSEFSMVRTKTRLASRTLTKLEVELHQISGRESSEVTKHPSMVEAKHNPALFDDQVPEGLQEKQMRMLTAEEQSQADEFLRKVNELLEQLVGASLLVSYENAHREVTGDQDRKEQVWDVPTGKGIPVLLVAGWTVKHPGNDDGLNLERKKLDLSLWLVPRSLGASQALALVDGRVELWVSSRKLDQTRMTFRIAAESEAPKSDSLADFLNRFAGRYRGAPPTLLVAHFHNLEWTQKNIVVSRFEK